MRQAQKAKFLPLDKAALLAVLEKIKAMTENSDTFNIEDMKKLARLSKTSRTASKIPDGGLSDEADFVVRVLGETEAGKFRKFANEHKQRIGMLIGEFQKNPSFDDNEVFHLMEICKLIPENEECPENEKWLENEECPEEEEWLEEEECPEETYIMNRLDLDSPIDKIELGNDGLQILTTDGCSYFIPTPDEKLKKAAVILSAKLSKQ